MKKPSRRSYWVILGMMVIVMSIGQAFIPMMGDDAFFTNQSFSVSWLLGRYQQWSSRFFIEATLVLISKQMWIFRIVNAGMFALLVDSFAKVTFGRRIESLLLIVGLFLFLPVTLFLSAGWLTTSINYIWVIALAFAVIAQIESELTISRVTILILLTLFSTNQEQVCIVVLLFLFGKITSAIVAKRKINLQYYLVLGMTLVNLVIILWSPGNSSRNAQSISTLFPEFGQFSLFDKLNLGISNTSKVLLVQQNFLMIVFLSMLAIYIILNRKSWYMKLIALVPLAVVPINVFLTTLTHNGYTIQSFSQYLLEKQSTTSLNQMMRLVSKLLTNDVSLMWNLFFIVIFICIIASLISISKNARLASIFLIGLASHAMMGFSPSIFKSGDRTAFILYMVIIYLKLTIIKKIPFKGKVE